MEPPELGEHGLLNRKELSGRSFPRDILRWAEWLPNATWLAEVWSVVSCVLAELRLQLHPQSHELFSLAAAALEACWHVARPLQSSLHKELQQVRMYLAECAGCMGSKLWHDQQSTTLRRVSLEGEGAVGDHRTAPVEVVDGATGLRGDVAVERAALEERAGALVRGRDDVQRATFVGDVTGEDTVAKGYVAG